MPQQEVLEEMIVRLMGDGSSYAQMWQNAQKQTTQGTSSILTRLNQFEATVNGMGNRLKSFGASLTALGTRFSMAITAPLTALAGVAVRETTQYEAALSRMSGLVGLTSDEISGFSVEIKKLAVETGKAPIELARAMENITSSGIKGKDALETLQITSKAAAGGLGEVRAVSDTVTSAMNAYGVANLSATTATDILVAAVREGKAEAESFAPVLGNVLPIANEMGISFDEAAGSIAYLTLATGSASTAATQYQNILAQTIKLNEKHDSGKILKEAGVSIKQFQKDVADKGLLPSLMALKDVLAGKGLSLKDAFPDVQAMTAALQLTGANSEKAKQVIESVGKAGGSVDTAFGAASRTKAFKFNQQMAEGKVILLELGDMFSEVLGKIMGFATSGIEIWKKLSDGSKQVIVNMLSIAAAMGPVLVATGMLTSAIGTVVIAGAGLAGLGITITSALLTPVGAAVAAITGLGIVIVTQTDIGKAAFKSMKTTVVDEFVAGFDSLKGHAENAMKGVTDAISGGDIKLAFQIGTNEAKIVWLEFCDYIRNNLTVMLQDLRNETYVFGQGFLNSVSGGLLGDTEEKAANSRVAPVITIDPKIQIAKDFQKKLMKEAALAASIAKEGIIDGFGKPEEIKAAGASKGESTGGTGSLPTTLDSLLKPGDIEKKVHVKVDFKTVGAGSGEHLDMMAEYFGGRNIVDEKNINLNIAKKMKGTKKQKEAAIAAAIKQDQLDEQIRNGGEIAQAGEAVKDAVPKKPKWHKFSQEELKENSQGADQLWKNELASREDHKREEMAKRNIASDDGSFAPGSENMGIDKENRVAQIMAERENKKQLAHDEMVAMHVNEWEHSQKIAEAKKTVAKFDERQVGWQPNHEGYTEEELNRQEPDKPWPFDRQTTKIASGRGKKKPEQPWQPNFEGYSEEELAGVQKPWEPDFSGFSTAEQNQRHGEMKPQKESASSSGEKNLDEMTKGINKLVDLGVEASRKKEETVTLTPAGLGS